MKNRIKEKKMGDGSSIVVLDISHEKGDNDGTYLVTSALQENGRVVDSSLVNSYLCFEKGRFFFSRHLEIFYLDDFVNDFSDMGRWEK